MTFINEGEWDRGIRLLAGISFLAAGSFASGVLGLVLVAAGALALITGIAGWCPAYSVFGTSTRKISAAHWRRAASLTGAARSIVGGEFAVGRRS